MATNVPAKRPAFQFYPGDWKRDAALQSCSIAARGLWIEMMCLMHEGIPYGYLKVGGKGILPPLLARLSGVPLRELKPLLDELETAAVFSRDECGAIYSRRMVRDEHLRQVRAAGGFKSLDNPNVPRPKDILQGLPEGGYAVPSPASACASASASHTDTGMDVPVIGGKPDELTDLQQVLAACPGICAATMRPTDHAALDKLIALCRGPDGAIKEINAYSDKDEPITYALRVVKNRIQRNQAKAQVEGETFTRSSIGQTKVNPI